MRFISGSIDVWDICRTCIGKKVVEGENGGEVTCPNCKGTGEVATRATLDELAESFRQITARKDSLQRRH